MSLEDVIAAAVERRLDARLGRLERLLGEGGASGELMTVTAAAKACGLHPKTVRTHYLARVTHYGSGRSLRISAEELRRAMAEDAGATVDTDALLSSIETKRRSRRG